MYPLAKKASSKALGLDPELAEAHASPALVALEYEWDWEGAEKGFRRAIELNPHYANAHHWYGEYLVTMNRFEEAVAEKKRALELQPLDPYFYASAGVVSYFRRNYDEAIDLFQKALELEPNSHAPRGYLGMSYMQKGMYEDAIRELEEAIKLSGPIPNYLGWLCAVHSFAGRRKDALKALEQLKEFDSKEFVPSFSFALAYLGLGDLEKALDYLQASYEDRDFPSFPYFRIDPIFESIRSNPRFQKILNDMNLPQE